MSKRQYQPVQKARYNLVGRRFGRLIVTELLGSNSNRHYWRCICDCGNESEVATSPLLNGNTQSCGCAFRENSLAASTTHGMSGTPLYSSWLRMLQRCEDKNCSDYQYYGARGITVCERWHSFELFYADVGERPEGMTLERINNNDGYGPDNFRWATRLEQMQNTRSTRQVEYEGRKWSISELARHCGIKPRTLNARINKLGYTVEQAVSKAVKPGAMLNGNNWRGR